MKSIDQNDVAKVARRLTELGERFVLVGGCALPFLVDEAYEPAVRPTMDVDVVVKALTRLEYSALEERLRKLGFEHDMRVGAPRCRWVLDGTTVDVMPSSPDAAEFGSRWFGEALDKAERHEVADGFSVSIAGPSSLLATKLDAFFSRGNGDYYGSRDLEDIVVLLEGCSRLPTELNASSAVLRDHVRRSMRKLLDAPAFIEALPALLSPESPAGVLDHVLQVARQIAGLS